MLCRDSIAPSSFLCPSISVENSSSMSTDSGAKADAESRWRKALAARLTALAEGHTASAFNTAVPKCFEKSSDGTLVPWPASPTAQPGDSRLTVAQQDLVDTLTNLCVISNRLQRDACMIRGSRDSHLAIRSDRRFFIGPPMASEACISTYDFCSTAGISGLQEDDETRLNDAARLFLREQRLHWQSSTYKSELANKCQNVAAIMDAIREKLTEAGAPCMLERDMGMSPSPRPSHRPY